MLNSLVDDQFMTGPSLSIKRQHSLLDPVSLPVSIEAYNLEILTMLAHRPLPTALGFPVPTRLACMTDAVFVSSSCRSYIRCYIAAPS